MLAPMLHWRGALAAPDAQPYIHSIPPCALKSLTPVCWASRLRSRAVPSCRSGKVPTWPGTAPGSMGGAPESMTKLPTQVQFGLGHSIARPWHCSL